MLGHFAKMVLKILLWIVSIYFQRDFDGLESQVPIRYNSMVEHQIIQSFLPFIKSAMLLNDNIKLKLLFYTLLSLQFIKMVK